jgi:hypothetical protein
VFSEGKRRFFWHKMININGVEIEKSLGTTIWVEI